VSQFEALPGMYNFYLLHVGRGWDVLGQRGLSVSARGRGKIGFVGGRVVESRPVKFALAWQARFAYKV
jgi:hypothetical protein